MKDHLGSTRAVTNSTNALIAAYNYDAWGYKLREWKSGDDAKYRFIGKERDNETNYDYFGARYYDARIGRWGGVEPKYDKYISISSYAYSLNDPIMFFDPNGKDPLRKYLGSVSDFKKIINENKGKSLWELGDIIGKSDTRYIYTEKGGFLDVKHFFSAASISKLFGEKTTLNLGELKEKQQELFLNPSAQNPEDRPSNKQGAKFGSQNFSFDNIANEFEKFMTDLNALEPNDEKISEDNIYIPYDDSDKKLPVGLSYESYHGEDPSYNPDYVKHAKAK